MCTAETRRGLPPKTANILNPQHLFFPQQKMALARIPPLLVLRENQSGGTNPALRAPLLRAIPQEVIVKTL
jgi:hypothetical protein